MPEQIDWASLDPFSLAPQFDRAIEHDEFVKTAAAVMAFVDDYNRASAWDDRE